MTEQYDDYEERRQARRDAIADAEYEMWRAGLNPDRLNHDAVDANYYRGMDWHEAAMQEARRQARMEQERRDEQQEHDGATP